MDHFECNPWLCGALRWSWGVPCGNELSSTARNHSSSAGPRRYNLIQVRLYMFRARAHTTNRKNAPLCGGNNLDACSRLQHVGRGVQVRLQLPHSFEQGDDLPLSLHSGYHPNTNAGKKDAMNEACLRALVVLLRKNVHKVRLAASNFRGAKVELWSPMR